MGNEFADQDILWGKKLTDNLIDLPGLYPLFDRILERFAIEPLELPKPKLKIYSSFNKLIETKYILYTDGSISETYLLFDAHLIDILGDLLDAYFDDTQYADSTRRISFRLIAEELYINSNLHGALHYSYNYRATDGITCFSSDRIKYIAPFTLAQEAFTLCHELSHWCLFRCNTESRNQQIIYKRALWNDYFEELIQKRLKMCDAKSVSLLVQMRETVKSNDRIVEECACDTFATIFLMETWDGLHNLTKVDIAIACFLAIQFLQLISFVRQSIDQFTDKSDHTADFTFSTTLRMLVFRHHIRSYLFTYSPNDVDSFDQSLTQCKEQFDRHIQDELFKILRQTKRELGHLNYLPRINFWDNSWTEINNLIKTLLSD